MHHWTIPDLFTQYLYLAKSHPNLYTVCNHNSFYPYLVKLVQIRHKCIQQSEQTTTGSHMTTSRLCGSHTVSRIINGVTEFNIS